MYQIKSNHESFFLNLINQTNGVWSRLRILGLTTLETRFLRAILIEVFKILKGFENVDPEKFKFFQVVGDDGRRGHMSSSCSRIGADWMLGDSSLRIGCVRSGTG